MKEQKESGKILHQFEKPRARTYCVIQEDKNDPWFVYVKKIDNKTKKITDESMIIAKDVESWVRGLKETGWIEKEVT